MNNALQRDTRLDFAKAIAISLVLFWHLQPIRLSVADNSSGLIKIFGIGLTLFYLQITLVAVPVFLLVSIYLFFQKIEDFTTENVSRRCLRIAVVYLFWTVCQFAFFYGLMFIQYFHNGVRNFSAPIPIHRLLMEGGPPLPIVGGSVFYFLFVLLILVLVSVFLYSFRNLQKIFFLMGALIVLFSFLYFEIINLNGGGLPYWRIDNFLIYVPLSYFLLKQKRENLVRYIPYFCMGFIH